MGLGSCDTFEEDVVPASFANIRIHPDEIYVYRNSIIAIRNFVNDTLESFENVTYTAPLNGKLTTVFTGNEDVLAYQPNPDYVGADSLTYQVCVGNTCKTAKIKFIVELPTSPNNCQYAVGEDIVETKMNTPVDIRMFVNDIICPQGHQLQWWPPQKGTYQIYDYTHTGSSSQKNMVFRYFPPKDYRGPDSFIYRLYPPGTYPDGAYLQMEVKITIK
jgi:hypothetical protein